MFAVCQEGYGGPETLTVTKREIPRPGPDEMLIRVHATSMHADIWHVVAGKPYILRAMGSGLLKPTPPVPGTDLAGIVEETGHNCKKFKPGDSVFGEVVNGMQWKNGGTYAEFAVAHQDDMQKIPGILNFEEAASCVTPGLIALRCLVTEGRLTKGQSVLINGAGGNVGSLAIQIAKTLDATVTGIDSAEKADLMKNAGADYIKDYRQEDITKGSGKFDLILDVASNLPFHRCKRILTCDGLYVLVGHDHYGKSGKHWFGNLPRVFRLLFISPFNRHLPDINFSLENRAHFQLLTRLINKGNIRPVIDRVYPLSKAGEALSYLESGQAKGKIVLTPLEV